MSSNLNSQVQQKDTETDPTLEYLEPTLRNPIFVQNLLSRKYSLTDFVITLEQMFYFLCLLTKSVKFSSILFIDIPGEMWNFSLVVLFLMFSEIWEDLRQWSHSHAISKSFSQGYMKKLSCIAIRTWISVRFSRRKHAKYCSWPGSRWINWTKYISELVWFWICKVVFLVAEETKFTKTSLAALAIFNLCS